MTSSTIKWKHLHFVAFVAIGFATLSSIVLFLKNDVVLSRFSSSYKTFTTPTSNYSVEEIYNNLTQRLQDQQPTRLIRRFSQNTTLNVERGLNIINCWSGHQMAAWVYDGMKPIDRKYRTWGGEPSEKIMHGAEYAGNLTDHDTIFVSYAKIEEFVNDFLPYINTTFVLITVPFHIMYPPGLETVANKIIHHDHLLHWFATNIGNYTGGYQFHPKVSPFPLGLKPKMGSRDFQNPIPIYRQVFLNAMNQTTTAVAPAAAATTTKDRVIFAGYISRTNQNRNAIPSGPKLQYTQYLLEIAKSSYVISPDGDHPDCHRHYESLGLGAIPITQLDPYLYSHLMEGPVIYNNTNWNLTELEESLPIPAPDVVNRNMIFEEYWMEYVEGVVGHPLNWWDVKKGKRLKLQDF